MKVLRSEVKEREQEILAEIDTCIAEQYAEADAATDAAADAAYRAMNEVVRDANRSIGDILAENHGERWRHRNFLTVPRIQQSDEGRRIVLRQAAISISKRRSKPQTCAWIERKPNLLRQLSIDALESDDARDFLASIPSVSDLVPVVRIAEPEATLGEPSPPFGPPRPMWG